MTRLVAMIAVLAAGCAVTLPAGAETAAECSSVLKSLKLQATAAQPLADGGCRIENVVVPLDGRSLMTLKVDEAEITTEPALPALASLSENDGPLPAKARLVLHRARIQVTTGSPVVDYVNNFRAVPFEIVFDYVADPKAGEIVVAELSARSTELGSVEMSGTVSGVPAAFFARPDPDLLVAAAVRRVSFDLDNRGLVEAFVVPPLAGALIDPATKDPFAEVEAIKRRAIEGLASTGERAGVEARTRDALAAFVAELPAPRKRLAISADFLRPFTVGEAMLIGAPGLPDQRLKDLSAITATYR